MPLAIPCSLKEPDPKNMQNSPHENFNCCLNCISVTQKRFKAGPCSMLVSVFCCSLSSGLPRANLKLIPVDLGLWQRVSILLDGCTWYVGLHKFIIGISKINIRRED